MIAPKVEAAEPLSLELEDLSRAIRTGAEPRSTPGLGLEIVRALEAAQESLANDGVPVALGDRNGNGSHPFGHRARTNGNGTGARANGNGTAVSGARLAGER
jgi:hypothetical protein